MVSVFVGKQERIRSTYKNAGSKSGKRKGRKKGSPAIGEPTEEAFYT